MKFKTRERTSKIVVHCSATPPSMDIGRKEIDQWHREKSWLAIGYHYVIRRDGTIELGRPQDVVGAHVRGHNNHSVGICLVGGVDPKGQPEDNFTDQQRSSLLLVVDGLRVEYPDAAVTNHHTLSPSKACPSFDAECWYESQ